jgi:Ca2+/H+ antiporter
MNIYGLLLHGFSLIFGGVVHRHQYREIKGVERPMIFLS